MNCIKHIWIFFYLFFCTYVCAPQILVWTENRKIRTKKKKKNRYKKGCLSELVKNKGRGKASLGSDGETEVEDEGEDEV